MPRFRLPLALAISLTPLLAYPPYAAKSRPVMPDPHQAAPEKALTLVLRNDTDAACTFQFDTFKDNNGNPVNSVVCLDSGVYPPMVPAHGSLTVTIIVSPLRDRGYRAGEPFRFIAQVGSAKMELSLSAGTRENVLAEVATIPQAGHFFRLDTGTNPPTLAFGPLLQVPYGSQK